MSSDAESGSFDLRGVEAGIGGTQFAGRLMYFPSVGSTNALALEAAQAGARGGVWLADEQTAGRGRGGHRWHSAAGEGLYVSALVTPSLGIGTALKLPLSTGLAVQSAILEITGLVADLRWPNDVLLRERKCGGILVETAVDTPAEVSGLPMLRYAVIGIGLNLNHTAFPPELRQVATSLRLELRGDAVRRDPLLAALLRALDREMRLLVRQDGDVLNGAGVLERFGSASTWVRGKRVRVGEGDGYTGVTAGLDQDGFLLVDGYDGVRHTVLSGGVREDSDAPDGARR